MINLILFGPPGSGKGTQAAKLVEQYNLYHISTGDMFRSEIGNKTELGLLAKSYMDKGALVPDEVTINMLAKRVEDNPKVKGFIFDGFPRTVAQATALDKMLAEKGTPITALLELVVPAEELIVRLMNRAKTSGRVDDGKPNIIKNRIQVYRETTAPVANYYDEQDKTYKVKGLGSIEEITTKLTDALDSVLTTV
ncbi:MAG: adenylate kinase [Saprospiraceae bacterium]